MKLLKQEQQRRNIETETKHMYKIGHLVIDTLAHDVVNANVKTQEHRETNTQTRELMRESL